jgi:hypothetical protein
MDYHTPMPELLSGLRPALVNGAWRHLGAALPVGLITPRGSVLHLVLRTAIAPASKGLAGV